MRVATIRLPSLRSATISSHVHRRAAARLIASRASYNRRRSNSTLAAEAPRASGSNIPLHVKPSHQHSPFASQGSTALTPLEQYRRLVDSGALKADEHQTRIIQRLQRLRDDLVTYDPPPIPSSTPSLSLLSRLFSSGSGHSVTVPEEQIPKGLYLYGDVGTGKTMLMDLFYNTLPDGVKRKRRVHFHSFMIDVHKRIHEAKKQLGLDGGDPIAPVARDLASEAYVLCFDEFQVTDIADAMILRQLFEKLLHYGVVCVMTSNRHPDELYKNGIQRSSFVPCIELIKERFEVTDLDSGTDYRRVPRALSHVYYDPISEDNRRELTKIWNAYTSHPSDPVVANRKLETWGRTLLVPESTSTVARFRFMDLCGNPLSAADYLEITKNFGTIFILDIPKMGLGQKDLARRFITFVDACYDSKVKLLALSEVPITKVFADDPNATDGDVSAHMRSIMDDLGLPSDVVGTSSMFTGEEELFAFARCCSRLVQMGSKDWAETAGIR